MTRDDTIRMAREAGWTEYSLMHPVEVERLKRFAALVADAIEQADKPWVKTYSEGKPVYTTSREWHALTDEEIETAWTSMNHDPDAFVHFAGGALWAEAKMKEKNG